MPKIFLIRHGETDWNRQRRVLGWSETPLNERGVGQAKALAGHLASYRFDALHASPLTRTRQTAEILGAEWGLAPQADSHFIEANVGEWTGRCWKDLADDKTRLEYYDRPTAARPPKGETFSEVLSRAVSGIEELIRKNPGGSFVVVTHADLIRCVLSHYLAVDIHVVRRFWIDHASLTALTLNPDGAVLHCLNLFSPSTY